MPPSKSEILRLRMSGLQSINTRYRCSPGACPRAVQASPYWQHFTTHCFPTVEFETTSFCTLEPTSWANLDDTNETEIPRPSPRFNAGQLDAHLQKAYSKLG
eukprot:1177805-Prorocentrum_minimum.AAC.3